MFPLVIGCAADATPCGPSRARVEHVIDGDTIVIEGGWSVRYLMVDAPEATGSVRECYGEEASRFNRDLVEGQAVALTYDAECQDGYGRLLAYVSIEGVDVSAALVERGYACVLRIPPNGAGRVEEFQRLEREAQSFARGLWGACRSLPCGR